LTPVALKGFISAMSIIVNNNKPEVNVVGVDKLLKHVLKIVVHYILARHFRFAAQTISDINRNQEIRFEYNQNVVDHLQLFNIENLMIRHLAKLARLTQEHSSHVN
jgi:hypothetical protein